jgi:hypothetical protein
MDTPVPMSKGAANSPAEMIRGILSRMPRSSLNDVPKGLYNMTH